MAEIELLPIFRVAAKVQATLEEAGYPFCFIGGVAIFVWGDPRFTRDVDLTVYTGFSNDESVATLLLSKFAARNANALEFALRSRVLLLHDGDVGVDVSLAGFPYEEEFIMRGSLQPFWDEFSLRVCSAEDLIILKNFAGRPHDIRDIAGILVRQKTLDWEYIAARTDMMAEVMENPEMVTRLAELRSRFAHS